MKLFRTAAIAMTFSCALALSGTASAAEYTHTLQPGQRLYPGDVLYSPSHAYRLIMQGDGNLVLYSGGTALWSSKTNGHSGASAVMQGDGNFVVYQSGKPLWQSDTDHHSGAILDMQDDGNLVIYWSGKAIWATGTNQPAAPQNPSLSPAQVGAAEYTHTLQPGQRLYPGDVLYSPSHAYRLIMQGDGNLVLYSGGSPLWSSRTNGRSGASAVMQGDGNFVVYQSGKPLWQSDTDHHPGAILDMQDDGNLVIYGNGKALWATGTNRPSATHSVGPHVVKAGKRLTPGTILRSPNGRYRLIMQGDGNLVVYQGSKAKWSTGTSGHPGASAVMQGDGNLVVYRSGKPLWQSDTDHHPGAVLDMQDDGNLVIYWSGKALWASKQARVTQSGMAIVRAAASQSGRPYCFAGGNQHGPTHGWGNSYGASHCGGGSIVGFDCTGLTQYAAYQGTKGAVNLSHHDSKQAKYAPGKWVKSQAALQPGDIVYFGYSRESISHAAIYAGVVGGRQMIWDADTAFWTYPDGVHMRTLASENSLHFVGAARVWAGG